MMEMFIIMCPLLLWAIKTMNFTTAIYIILIYVSLCNRNNNNIFGMMAIYENSSNV